MTSSSSWPTPSRSPSSRFPGRTNYIRTAEPEIGVWFRHFRRIGRNETRYYADYITDARTWQRIPMTDAISVLTDPQSQSYQLIEQWLAAVGQPVATP